MDINFNDHVSETVHFPILCLLKEILLEIDFIEEMITT